MRSNRVYSTRVFTIYWTMDILEFNLFNKINNHFQLQETDCSNDIGSKKNEMN